MHNSSPKLINSRGEDIRLGEVIGKGGEGSVYALESDDRFVAVLRRLDIGLGELIARKILDSVREAMGADGTNLPATVAVRCGLAADSHCTFESLLGRASDALQQARDGRRELVSQPPAGHQVFAGALA